jgi:hypothetical protein
MAIGRRSVAIATVGTVGCCLLGRLDILAGLFDELHQSRRRVAVQVSICRLSPAVITIDAVGPVGAVCHAVRLCHLLFSLLLLFPY